MKQSELVRYFNRFKFGEDSSHALMRFRVQEVLIVSTFYDAFILEQDGRVADQVSGQFRQLNLTTEPRLTSVPTGQAALRKLRSGMRYDMVITMSHIADMEPGELARMAKEIRPDIPVLMLRNTKTRLAANDKRRQVDHVDRVFAWTGDPKIFLAMIKYVEDRANVDRDTRKGMVQVILLVEDSVRFYSRYLPELYREVMTQVQRLISEELSNTQRVFRMRARPKVLLANTFEQATAIADRYADNLLCVITDLRYPRGDDPHDAQAGVKLVDYLRERIPGVPIAIQTAEASVEAVADELGVAYLRKHSKSLMSDLSRFIHSSLGFGDFVFRDAKGREIDRARTMLEFERKLHTISPESLAYHSSNNHFSTWLLAHGAPEEARKMRSLGPHDFKDTEAMRHFLVEIFARVRAAKNQGQIVDFDINAPVQQGEITRLSMGSLGGKGRGIAFLNSLLVATRFHERFEGLNVRVPVTAFIGTSEYDQFLADNMVREKLVYDADDAAIKRTFVQGRLSGTLRQKLSAYLRAMKHPIAVRSSGLLEDSQEQPFAGVYQTYMLPNSHPELRVRLEQLENAIKLVFASAFLGAAERYIQSVSFDTEQEKMAVIIQEVVGDRHGDFFYPSVSGVAQSYNYYPVAHMEHHDGITSVALGLGYWVVEGNRCLRFCPVYPKLEILQPDELVVNSQRKFYAIDMRAADVDLQVGEMATIATLSLEDAEAHGTLEGIASTWVPADGRMRHTIYARGQRVVTFAGILRYEQVPLAPAIHELLEIGETAFGVPVEVEFALKLPPADQPNTAAALYVLQIRPLTVDSHAANVELDGVSRADQMLCTNHALGHGVVEDVYDVVFIDPKRWDRTMTREMRREIADINREMGDRRYILIAPGRWGSRDRFLGVPVQWSEIDHAAVIVETSLDGFIVEASQGTHFFHNVVAMNVGYFTVRHTSDDEHIDWDWLRSQPTVYQGEYASVVRCELPFVIRMRGRDGKALIEKPRRKEDPDEALVRSVGSGL